MRVLIDGVDITSYIASEGLQWKLSDLDSDQAGRTLDGVMHRARIDSKVTLDVACRPLRAPEARILLNAIFPEFVQVQYDDPAYGVVTRTMYSNNRPAAFWQVGSDGVDEWAGINFPLIEQ